MFFSYPTQEILREGFRGTGLSRLPCPPAARRHIIVTPAACRQQEKTRAGRLPALRSPSDRSVASTLLKSSHISGVMGSGHGVRVMGSVLHISHRQALARTYSARLFLFLLSQGCVPHHPPSPGASAFVKTSADKSADKARDFPWADDGRSFRTNSSAGS